MVSLLLQWSAQSLQHFQDRLIITAAKKQNRAVMCLFDLAVSRVRWIVRCPAQILLPLCIPTACKAAEGTAICATLLHNAIFALGGCRRVTRAVLSPEPLTFFSGGSLQPESLSRWRSWNLTLTSSMLSWSRSQKLARSWVVGWGYAAGSWRVRQKSVSLSMMNSLHTVFLKKSQRTNLKSRVRQQSQLCKWISITIHHARSNVNLTDSLFCIYHRELEIKLKMSSSSNSCSSATTLISLAARHIASRFHSLLGLLRVASSTCWFHHNQRKIEFQCTFEMNRKCYLLEFSKMDEQNSVSWNLSDPAAMKG